MIARRLRRSYLLTVLLVTVLVFAVHSTAVRSIIGEVRKLLAGVAASAAEGLMAIPGFGRDFQLIDGSLDPLDTADPRHAAFLRMSSYLEEVQQRFRAEHEGSVSLAPRITYIYALRRVRPTDPVDYTVVDAQGHPVNAPDTWQFVVDAVWYTRDLNSDGIIDAGEVGARPGLNYPEGLEADMLEAALQGPTADREFHRDQWGTFLSGYAPLYDEGGTPIGVLGVDLRKDDLLRTLLKIRLVSGAAWLTFVGLVTLAFHFLSGRLRAFEELKRLDEQLEHQNRTLHDKNEDLAAANREFARQLELAKRVQQRFLPVHLPQGDSIRFGSIYLACEAVGGDIYDVFPIDEAHVGLYIADVSGHGISAALIGATLKMSVEAMKTAVGSSGSGRASILYRPRDMVVRLHDILCENLAQEHFITMQYAVLDTRQRRVTLCNAGHTWPVWWHAGTGRAELVETHSGLPIGYLDPSVLVEQTLDLAQGDKIILYTDGLTETHSADPDDLFGEERLAAIVTRHGRESADDLVSSIKREADDFAAGTPMPDDVALIVAEMLGNGRGPALP